MRDVEFLRRRLSVSENATRVSGRIEVGKPKSGKARSVPVPEFVLDALSVQCAGKSHDDLVFPARDGGYLRQAYPKQGWFPEAVKRAGIMRITPHDLRHSCASLAVSAGVNVLALQRMLGHAQPSMTLNVYADLFDSDLDAAAAVMHSRYARSDRAASVPKMCPPGVHDGS